MKVYLVGGAVRDRLLGYPVKERDWVVVGSSPEELVQQGFQQVGRDFPVFLHPKTREEYALARTERKIAPGYHGFVFDVNPAVSLQEDLARRDLTINAIAMDAEGKLIDPYHGQDDLRAKRLRHVSPSFAEDPVRVLRVARFAARYHHLGFKLADETRVLMYQMVKRGELEHLVAERVWQEWEGSLEERHPEQFILTLRSCGALRAVLPEIDSLFGIPNPTRYHPEVDSGVHTLMVLRAAAVLTEDPVVRFAALTHDVGKALTPMSKWPSHHGHEQLGKEVIDRLCKRLRIPGHFRSFAKMVSEYHLMIHRLYELRANTIVNVLEQTDAFRRRALFEKLLLVCKADAQNEAQQKEYTQPEEWKTLLDRCTKLNAQVLVMKGLEGEAIKSGFHQLRIDSVRSYIKTWKKHEK